MKQLIVLILLLCTSPAFASGWYWLDQGNGYYLKSDGTNNDGFLYRRKCSYGCRKHCSHCEYIPVKAIAQKVEYRPDWTVSVANAAYQLQDRQLFLQALKELSKLGPSSSSYDYEYSTTSRGYGLVRPQEFNQLDANAAFHSLERVTLRQSDSVDSSVAALGAATQKAVETNKQLMAFQAFGQMIQPQPSTETTLRVGSGSTGSVSALGGGLAAMKTLLGQAAITQHCASCHSGAAAKGGLNLAAIASYGAEDRKAIRAESLDRMIGEKSQDDSLRMPANHAPLSAEISYQIADYIAPAESEPLSYRPKAQAKTEEAVEVSE